ncbi:MAG TPA: Gfo/Idh/MocA family oxidoreductase [Longimicrobiales bacterium]|nr:Gfo/Idh/MocA family oxidoreductase [Longimicrobiales bacterium]
MVNVGVIGVGSLGFHHARILAGMDGVRMVGVHDTDAARLGQVGRELGLDTFDRVEPLLAAADAVVVAVPTVSHEAVAVRAAEHGVNMLIEKPIAPSLDAADRIVAAAAGSDVLVQIGHVERFNSALRAAEPYLDEPLFVECHRLAPFGPRGTDVAVVLDLMIHDLDLLLSLIDRPVTHIAAAGVPVLTTRPDIANARLEFEGGGVANLTASRVSQERVRKFRFFQRSGYISLDLAAGRGEFLRLRPGLSFEPGEPIPADRLEEIVERVTLVGDDAEPLKVELDSFVRAVAGEAAVAVDGAAGRRALAVALEIVERIEEHVAATHTARA